MSFKSLTPDFFVMGQIGEKDIESAAAMGITTIICNRPDGESPDQPESAAIADLAASAGLTFVHIPVVAGSIDDGSVEAFAAAINESDGPVLGYCRSGMRASCLWALASAGQVDTNAIIGLASDAGYDVSPLAARINSRCAQND